ncbi:uncharacterized protein LOC127880865 isoform X3 [Dreissena polymorpha]|uniref:uncharacterized protein LOC127880865 isoform X3 n=1 Tax=Dreissena polymorpha TaxID=45954 RepID=UPI0022642E9D|nr:uncharacterized protein LOC127880865 isoform X3 [Dreissena polymorpha]
MPKNKNKIIAMGTSSLKVKPKKRPGLIKQLSQPFLASNKKNKNASAPDITKLDKGTEDFRLFNGYDDMFLPNKHNRLENTVFLSPEKELETFLNFNKSPLSINIPSSKKCSSADSGYMSPPCPADILSPGTPAKGILKKLPTPEIQISDCNGGTKSLDSDLMLKHGIQNGRNTPEPARAMSPIDFAMSPPCDSIENAFSFLDNMLFQEKKNVKKSVSFGNVPEVKNFSTDSSEDSSSDDSGALTKPSSASNVDNMDNRKQHKKGNNYVYKKSVSFDDMSVDKKSKDQAEFLMRSQSCEQIPLHDTDSSEEESEKNQTEGDAKDYGCQDVCQYEVEVKVIDIQPTLKGEGQSENDSYVALETCTVLNSFQILICHHPGCTQNNEDRPMLLCKECDMSIHARPEFNGHLVLDVPKRKSSNERTTRFAHANSTPSFSNQSLISMDIDEGLCPEEEELPVPMEMDRRHSFSKVTETEDDKKLKRKKVVKAKRRHTTGVINHETFTLKIRHNDDEEIEIIAAERGVSLRESLLPILERRGLDIEEINIFVEASNTPLPLNCETFLLGGTTMYIKQKDCDPPLPSGSQSLSKATGSKLTGGAKNQSNKSKSGGSLRSRRGNLSIDDSTFPMELRRSVSPQGTLREIDSRKQKQPSKLTTLFSPMNKDREKQDQLNDLLNTYSATGLPSFPDLVKLSHPDLELETFSIESDWREIVTNSQDFTKRQKDQQEAIWELLQTELQYIRSIRVISDLFLCVLLNLQNEQILNEIDTHTLFNNIDEIMAANCLFWRDHLRRVLEESRATASPLNPSLMKEGFQKYHDIFQTYVQYFMKHKVCTDYMKSQYSDNELFKIFVIWAEAQKQCNRLKLTDLLVKPMQRLTKYSLLLQAILRKTDDDQQRRDVLEMIATVDRFVHHVDSTLHQQLEEEKLQAIVDKIEPYDAVDAPNDECVRLILPYNSNFNLLAPMPGCTEAQTRSLVMQSPLKMKVNQNRMDVECLLFTDLLLICKNKRMDKYKIVKPPMRVDRIITHELKDKGSFLLIYVNEYHVPMSSFTFHGDQSAVNIWLVHIKKAQDLYQEAKMAGSAHPKPTFPQSEIITEEVIGYTTLYIGDNSEGLPLFQLQRCSSEEPEAFTVLDSAINRSRSWNEMTSMNTEPQYSDLSVMGSGSANITAVPSAYDLENMSTTTSGANFVGNHATVQYSRSDPSVFSQFIGDDRLQVPQVSISAGTSESDMSILPEFVDEGMKSKLYQRRQRTERFHTADAVRELNKDQNRDNSIHKRLSWNFPNGNVNADKQGVLKTKVLSSDSMRSFPSSSGVSSTGSLHLNPDGDICEEDSDLEGNDNDLDREFSPDVNEDDVLNGYHSSTHHGKSTSANDIVHLMQDLNTTDIHGDMKDGIKSIDLPLCEDPNIRLSHAQLLRMKKQLLLSSNVEASEV